MKKIIVLVLSFSALTVSAQKNPCDPSGKNYKDLPGDTTIVLPSGSTLTFNRCEFFDIRDCIQILEISDTAQLARERINMYDQDGNVLVSYGMIKIDLDSCAKRSFDVAVRFRMRIRADLSCFDTTNVFPRLYIYRPDGWDNKTGVTPKIITIGNEKYIEFSTPLPGAAWNIDVLKGGRMVKFIAPAGGKITELKIATGCPLFYVEKIPTTFRRKMKLKLACGNPDFVGVISEIRYDSKDSIDRKKRILPSLKHGAQKLKCSTPRTRFFARLFDWSTKRRSEIRKKYYL